jgi:hypothetical protein
MTQRRCFQPWLSDIYIFTAHADIFHLIRKARASKTTEFMHVHMQEMHAKEDGLQFKTIRTYKHTVHVSCMYKKISIMPNVDCRLDLVAELLLLLWFIACLLYYNRVEYIDMNVCIYIFIRKFPTLCIYILYTMGICRCIYFI